MLLLLTQRRNKTLVRESCERSHKVRIPLAVNSTLATVLDVEDGVSDPFLLAN
jgi:hypothetical protein